ncbi:MAG: hypothetical protein HC898_03080 [Phycisphaerales bacterium]|nr:hypothetical protein [Phycisphaerales bacterium]
MPTTLPPKAPTIAPDRWELKDLIGDCYGGKVLGSGTIVPGKPGGYSIQLVLDGAALDSLVNPRRDISATNGSNGKAAAINGNKPTGRVSANLAMEGVGDGCA